ncbi:tyrosine-type recombinase/integrase [Paenibacillus sp. Marseille-P2973]|uniref:tyrosine-type recombinase/integrase n=1 Tax=Paenibacillus sp. Marseille-P2973 TaxID=1871032 RepID=UPI001B360C84|nr:tyrosine-type recombinase/integrase [Paenibacillus sp. Marseille-P2973]MBQ4901238.1 tyrosine-type recombinase/integrase [Paenibacillus sp. Marseille-P2973]
MSIINGKTPHKRGQRKNNLPQRLLDRLTPSVLEAPRPTLQETEKPHSETLTLDKLFKRYYVARQAAGAAERTLEDYRKHMNWFRRFLASEYSGLDNFVPNRDVIRSWISHMLTVQKLKPSTINIRLRTIKAMFNWGMSERIIKESPFENVELLKVPEEDFQVISKVQERKLFNCCELTTFTGLRDALLMSFLLDTGVRIGECMRIFVEEVDLQNRSASVRAESAKTRKARIVYFGVRTQELLFIYLAWHKNNAEAPNLFLNEFGQPLDKNWATRCISFIGKKAKITGVRISPHTFRHTFATRYIKATGDPFSLRRLLGHSSMEMVNRYVNQDTTDVREQYEKFMNGGTER